MAGRTFDVRHLDVAAFAERGGELSGALALVGMARLVDSADPEAPPAPDEEVRWQARGERRRSAAGGEDWLYVRAETALRLTCQRCLQAVRYEIDVDRSFRFVADEAAAATLDAESEEDLLVHTRSLDLASLIEDELLLALPLVPRHEGQCPQPLIAPPDPVAAAIAAAPPVKPFASLAGLKVRKTSS